MHKDQYEPPMFCAAIPVLAQTARHSGFLTYFFRSVSMMDFKSSDLPVPYILVNVIEIEAIVSLGSPR